MLWKYVEQIINVYDYVDGVVIINCDGIIEYYFNNQPQKNRLTNRLVEKKHVLDIWTNLTESTSTLLKVLRTKKPILNVMQKNITCLGDEIHSINSSMPITNQQGDLIGAIDVSVYVAPDTAESPMVLNVKNRFQKPSDKLFTLDKIITNSKEMLNIKEKIHKISNTNSSILIYGETGTGKELMAQSIHTSSNRKTAPFIAQNCAALPSTLFESILFGTVKGSYTGSENQKGLFELAQGGTLFLDEINLMEMNLQAKILRALEERKIRRVGDDKEISIDIRLISATNQDPIKMLSENKIRHDLFYRISPVQIHLPPLRKRKSDIPLLVDHFIKYFNHQMKSTVIGVADEVMDHFINYYWPGNVRELKNVIEGCFNIMSGKFIKITDLPRYMLALIEEDIYLNENSDTTLYSKIEEYEKQLIVKALKKHYTLTKASESLGLSKQALRYKLMKHNIKIKDFN